MKNINSHKTSANMDGEVFDSINKTAAFYNIKSEKIFIDLITLLLNSANCSHILNLLTEYQDHSPKNWETFYYSLDENEIEIFSKARQKYKISISKLAFMAFVVFWKSLLLRYSIRLTNSKNEFLKNSY
ncbi:MAG: hypothetical protein JW982_04340, partial [Spirochaetes bacterium]|nr:hypothetical protein [Spirochaetota bacterium]